MRILPPPMSLGRANSEGEDDCQEAAPVPAADTDQDMSTAQGQWKQGGKLQARLLRPTNA